MVFPDIVPVTVQEQAVRLNKGGSLHPAGPDWLPPTKQPRTLAGRLITASVTNVSYREGLLARLRRAPALGGTPWDHQTSSRMLIPKQSSGIVLLPGSRGCLVSHSSLRLPGPGESPLPPLFLGAAEVSLGGTLLEGPGPPALQGYDREPSTPAGGRMNAAGRMGSHAG